CVAPAIGRHAACIVCEVMAPSALDASWSMFRSSSNFSNLPHERLHAYKEARSLLLCVQEAKIADGKLRDQAMRAARRVCLTIAEGAGRSSAPDKESAYAVAPG